MDNLLVWLFLGPFLYSWQLAGPFVGLFLAGYIRALFGFRIWATLLSSFCSSFLYYVVIIPSDGMLGGLWILKLVMGLHTALFVTMVLWIYDKLRRGRRNEKTEDTQDPPN